MAERPLEDPCPCKRQEDVTCRLIQCEAGDPRDLMEELVKYRTALLNIRRLPQQARNIASAALISWEQDS